MTITLIGHLYLDRSWMHCAIRPNATTAHRKHLRENMLEHSGAHKLTCFCYILVSKLNRTELCLWKQTKWAWIMATRNGSWHSLEWCVYVYHSAHALVSCRFRFARCDLFIEPHGGYSTARIECVYSCPIRSPDSPWMWTWLELTRTDTMAAQKGINVHSGMGRTSPIVVMAVDHG